MAEKNESNENAQLQNVLNRIAEELVTWVQYKHTGAIMIRMDFNNGQVKDDVFQVESTRTTPAQKPYLKPEK